MIHISAFADEIALDPREQIAVLQSEDIHFLDLRAAWGTNVLDLSDGQVDELRRMLNEQGMAVSAIASPIDKVPVDSPFDEHLGRFERAIALAHFFDTPTYAFSPFIPHKPRKAIRQNGETRYCGACVR